jgi:hypothetical protein
MFDMSSTKMNRIMYKMMTRKMGHILQDDVFDMRLKIHENLGGKGISQYPNMHLMVWGGLE